MNIITIGDLHGSPAWKQIQPGDWDRMVFIGDYVDSFEYSDDEIMQNLMEILDLKNTFPAKVVLLWGNHDLAYFYGGHPRHYCSGFRKSMLSSLYSLYTSNAKLFSAAFQIDGYLWTHAGIVGDWYESNIREEAKTVDDNLAATLNRLFLDYYEPLFQVSWIRGGMHQYGGIFWAHSSETKEDPLKGYHQIVGHTKTRSGVLVENHYGNNTSIAFVDCLDTSEEFYKLIVE
jgi:predicted MPP superfamily phosphohydrolase